jgi:serine/threonine-protein kinase
MQKRFQVNELIGEYRVTGFLGEGGMGEVYLGLHEKLGRPAAIKILGAAASDPTFKTRFFNEARVQAGLHHPNIAALYDFREEAGQLFIFMEFVDGESLEDLIKRRAFTVDETLEVFGAICEAIAYIHRNGVVHRDIKSQNVKVSSAGVVKLLDFGIAKDSASHGLTQTGGVIGTPTYLSPEQLSGQPATARADIWALGVLLYEMLTGRPPFQGDTLGGLVLQISNAEFAAPETINPAVSREVAGLVRKCLKKDPGSRYQTADELAEAVRKALNKENAPTVIAGFKKTFGFKADAVPATLVSTEPAARPAKRLPWGLIAFTGSAILLLFVAVITGIWMMSGSGTAQTSATTGNLSTTPAKGNLRVRVDVDEGKATVVRNGQTLGTTPLDLDASLGENVGLTLRREGYGDKNVNLEITNGKKVFTFSLKAK